MTLEDEDERIPIYSNWIHNKSGERYVVLGLLIAEHPDTGEWFRAVHYQNKRLASFIRQVDRFLERFTREEN